ncbi:oligosaccharyl transferase subunit ost3/OST6 [Lunasporangiospora selenospora]|uniref:Oligosaccharyl transferase subunit ost3/OST6 n=1 Tax=Lunasporangiospora selenospora TaxID=979761 RepID=A0A9P6KF32_9FUNG|nr:oligosaccharyl transferase subunit ost3/OST6 [Lunasporangiospora selenospora]
MANIISRACVLIAALISLSLLGSLALVATVAEADNAALLEKKLDQLRVQARKNKGIIDMDSNTFEEVMAKPRDFPIVVLFTAISPEFQCVPCKNFDPEYRLVASGSIKKKADSQLFFGILDFKRGQATFQKFGMNSAPSALYFPATESIGSVPQFDRYDFGKYGFQAEEFANWLSARSGVHLSVRRPFDVLAFVLKLLFVLLSGTACYALYARAGKVVRSKYLWAGICLFTIFIMISGHMWNQIRRPPYSMPGQGFVAAGFQNQFGIESQLVAVMYAVLCGAVISLISSVTRIEDAPKQRISVWVWMLIFGFMYSILLQTFRLKNPGYPFRLLF